MTAKPSKKQLQKIWDETLVTGWEREWQLMGVGFNFIRKVAPVLALLQDFRRIKVYITSLGLKRCMERERGELVFIGRGNVRAFVDFHSRQLTNFLYSGNHAHADILKNIDCFKWNQVNRTKVTANRRHRIKRRKATDTQPMIIHWRDRDARADWNKVK